jgi:Xaa-Pro dipeptidase
MSIMHAQKSLAFELAEYRRRVTAVQARMGLLGLDLMLATTMASVCYLSGLESVSPHKLWLVAVPASGEPEVLCQDFESYNALLDSWLEPGFMYGVGQEPIPTLAGMVKKMGFERARIGLEECNYTSISIADYERLKGLLPGAKFVEATDCVQQVMSIKSEAEVEYLRQAGRMTGIAMAAAMGAIKEGVRDNDVAAAAAASLYREGSEYSSYPVIVTTGARSGVPHTTFKRMPILQGDPVFVEIAGCVRRYQTPMMRVGVLGEASQKVKEMARAAAGSVEAMVQNIRPGAVMDEVAARSAKALESLPYKVVWHGFYGYSVGLGFVPEWSDCPGLLIRRGAMQVLEPGMVFHASTSLRDIGVCGATCSETILVTESGCEVLTAGPLSRLLV